VEKMLLERTEMNSVGNAREREEEEEEEILSGISRNTTGYLSPPHTHISLYTGISFFDPFLALRNKEFLRPME
jgi:hypothetical protein